MKKHTIAKRLMAACLGLSLLLAGCGEEVAQVDAEVSLGTPVEVQQLKKATIKNELTYIGQVEPQVTVSVASQISAEVMSVNFAVGDMVQQGDVLFTVDASDIEDQVRQLQANAAQTHVAVEQAQYGLEIAQEGSAQERLSEIQYESGIYSARYGTQNASNGRDSADDAVDSYKAAAETAYATWKAEQAYLELMQDALDNNGGILDGDTVTPAMITAQQADVALAESKYYAAEIAVGSADTTYDGSKIAKNQADKSLDLAYDSYEAYKDVAQENTERSIRNAQYGVMSAEASLTTVELQLSIAESNLGKASVTSPVSGVVSVRNIEPGTMISPASLPYTIVKMDVVNVQVSVSESLINSINPGDEVQVLIQSVSEEPIIGVVATVSPVASASSTYPVLVELDNADGIIKPGMFSQVGFVKDQKDDTFVVDKSVVLSDDTSQYVFIVEDGTAKKVTVTTGLANGSEIEILSGVSVGDDIVVVGQEYLYDGTAVNIVKRDGEAVASGSDTPDSAANVDAELAAPDDEAGEETTPEEQQDEENPEESALQQVRAVA